MPVVFVEAEPSRYMQPLLKESGSSAYAGVGSGSYWKSEDPRTVKRLKSRKSFNEVIARRPVRGVQIKRDRFATMRVVDKFGNNIMTLDQGSPKLLKDDITRGGTEANTNFILQQVVEQRAEKVQIVQTFGEDYVFVFGEFPVQLQCTAMLVNTLDFQWKYEFIANYRNVFRATRLADLQARVLLIYDETIQEGYLTNMTITDVAESPYHVSLSFTFLVTNTRSTAAVGEMDVAKAFSLDPDDYKYADDYYAALKRGDEEEILDFFGDNFPGVIGRYGGLAKNSTQGKIISAVLSTMLYGSAAAVLSMRDPLYGSLMAVELASSIKVGPNSISDLIFEAAEPITEPITNFVNDTWTSIISKIFGPDSMSPAAESLNRGRAYGQFWENYDEFVGETVFETPFDASAQELDRGLGSNRILDLIGSIPGLGDVSDLPPSIVQRFANATMMSVVAIQDEL